MNAHDASGPNDDLLGIRPAASDETIVKAFRKRSARRRDVVIFLIGTLAASHAHA